MVRMFICVPVVLSLFVFCACGGSGGGPGGGPGDIIPKLDDDIWVECGSPSFSEVRVDESSHTERFTAEFSMDFNNPFIFYVGKAYIIPDPDVVQADFDEYFDYTGPGFEIASVARNVDHLDFTAHFAYDRRSDELTTIIRQGSYENEESFALTSEFQNVYLLLLGGTSKGTDMSFDRYYDFTVTELPLQNRKFSGLVNPYPNRNRNGLALGHEKLDVDRFSMDYVAWGCERRVSGEQAS